MAGEEKLRPFFTFVLMKINLFRSDDCAPEVLEDVYNLLNTFNGPMKFVMKPETTAFADFVPPAEDPYKKVLYEGVVQEFASIRFEDRYFQRKTLAWNNIFLKCESLRKQHDIGRDEFVILLTSHNNDLNWFSAGNPLGPRDHFVHTEDWDFFVGSDRRFPIAYQIASGVLKKFVFKNYDDLDAHWHQKPIGCMLDFCQNKQEIVLKVRTGDICTDCLEFFEERKVPKPLLKQVFDILDGIRENMLFKSRYKISGELPVLHIVENGRELIFPDLCQLRVHLNPLEKTLYLFFLNHKEGILMSHLPDYRDEIRDIYRSISNADSNVLMEERITELVDPRSNSASEKISRIKRKFAEALGDEMAAPFIIAGANGKKKRIAADRSLIIKA
jgi:hypothetical protein